MPLTYLIIDVQHPHIIDATQQRSGLSVQLKRVPSAAQEIQIARFLSSQNEQDSHCVVLLDVFTDPIDADTSIIVMPHLFPFGQPAFEPAEAIDFVRQTLEVGHCYSYDLVALAHFMLGSCISAS